MLFQLQRLYCKAIGWQSLTKKQSEYCKTERYEANTCCKYMEKADYQYNPLLKCYKNYLLRNRLFYAPHQFLDER